MESSNILGRGKGFIVNLKPSDVVGVLAQWLNHNMPRSAAQRKMQMGVSGRALGIGVALERPVGPDRRNDVWAVAGTGKSSLTRSLCVPWGQIVVMTSGRSLRPERRL